MKNRIIRHLALFASIIVLLTSTYNTTLGFIITKTEPLINTFKPLENIMSDMFISKKVEHSLGENYLIPNNISFDFKVELGAFYANTVIATTDGNKTADEEGNFVVSLRPEKTLGIDGIDVGTKVKVTELEKEGSGFAVKGGDKTREVVILENECVGAEFVNIYSPKAVTAQNINVIGEKNLEGREWQEGDSFTFLLQQKNDGKWTDLATKSITYSSENKDFNQFDFNDLMDETSFDGVGCYEFRLLEVKGSLGGMVYDESSKDFSIIVTDFDMDGSLEISDVKSVQNVSVEKTNGNFDLHIAFNNKFQGFDDISLDIMVNKTVKNMGAKTIGPEGFEFVLENVDSGEKLELKSDKNGEAVFNLHFTESDIGKNLEYKLYEIKGFKRGVTYDDNVYRITVNISEDSDNKLKAVTTLNGKEVGNIEADFINVYYGEDGSPPTTGDNSNTLFWFITMILSAASCVILIILEKTRVNK